MATYISAGHGGKDPGAIGNGYKEAILTIELRNLVTPRLKALGVKFFVDDDRATLAQVVSNIKSGDGSVVYDIHFNAAEKASATGVEVIIPDGFDANEKKMAQRMVDACANIMGIANRGVKTESQSHRGKLAMMRPKGINMLIEVCFISNADDMKKYQAKKVLLADAIARILKEADDLVA